MKNNIRIIDNWPKYEIDEVKIESLKKYRKLISKEHPYEIDEASSEDLNLIEVFNKTNRCYSTIGSQCYFDILHKPLMNKEDIRNRRDSIDRLKENNQFRKDLSYPLLDLGYSKYVDPLDILFHEYKVNKKATFTSIFILITMLTLIIISVYTSEVKFAMYALLIFGAGNMLIASLKNNSEVSSIKGLRGSMMLKSSEEGDMNSFLQLTRVISTGIALSKVENNLFLVNKINKKSLDNVRQFMDSVSAYTISKSNPFLNLIVESLFLQFLIYQKAIKSLSKYREDILDIIRYTGEIDSLIGMATYFKELENEKRIIIRAKHVDTQKYISIENATHPLVENCIENSITMNNNGIILTGSNMSGKSTFMRTIGINCLFSQICGYVFASNYESSILNISSSLVSSDDILSGKSYFMDEAYGILRLINKVNEEYTSLFLIDEIFRGTNPIERISASSSIIDYIQNKNAICIVATHDKDIVYLSKSNFENYHFAEKVIDGKLHFDYKIKSGVAGSSNALLLMESIGYPKEIIEASKKIINENNNLTDYKIIN